MVDIDKLELIKQAIEEADSVGGMVGITTLSKWKKQGIYKCMRRADTIFLFDREIEFVDGSTVIVWI